MSVTSVRAAAKAAVADKKVSLKEAEKITRTAGRTSGISLAERRELAKAAAARSRFEPGARAHLLANAAAAPTSATPTVKALEQHVNARGLDAISNLPDADEDKFSPELMAALEKFAGITDNQDGDSIAYTARELKVGKEKLYVVNDYEWGKDKEHVGFFTAKGVEVGRASVTKGKDELLSMKWETLGGKSHKSPIGTPSLHTKDALPANFKKDLEKWVDDKNGDDLGKRVDSQTLPPEVRRQYEVIMRNASDSTGAEKISFKGKTIYALHDFSSVTSSYFFTASGNPLFSKSG
jgi:hypothetical protein